jgi:hypothetical protein
MKQIPVGSCMEYDDETRPNPALAALRARAERARLDLAAQGVAAEVGEERWPFQPDWDGTHPMGPGSDVQVYLLAADADAPRAASAVAPASEEGP